MKTDLFSFSGDGISIRIEAGFAGEALVVEGYDIGRKVEEWWGDSDYEYSITVPAAEVAKLYPLLGAPPGEKPALLQALADRFHGNRCFSEFGDFLAAHGVAHETFSWT